MSKKLALFFLTFVVIFTACSKNDDDSVAPLSTETVTTSSDESNVELEQPNESALEPISTHFQETEVTINDFFAPYIAAFSQDFPTAAITQMRWQFFEVSEKDTFVIQGIDGEEHISVKYIMLEEPIEMGRTVEPFTEEKKSRSAFPKTQLDTTGILSATEIEKIINETYNMELTEIIFENTHGQQIFHVLFRDTDKKHYRVAMDPQSGEILVEYFRPMNGDE